MVGAMLSVPSIAPPRLTKAPAMNDDHASGADPTNTPAPSPASPPATDADADAVADSDAARKPNELRRAAFTDKAVLYHTVSATIGASVVFLFVGALLAIPTLGVGLVLWLVPVAVYFLARWYYRIYFGKLECVLTERKLHVGKGVLFRVEKAIPLDKITDLSMNQGPLLRKLDLEAMGVETAGQSGSQGGALVKLVGIEGSREFREAVLEQRDRVVGTAHASSGARPGDAESTPAGEAGLHRSNEQTLLVLTEIRDALHRVEAAVAAQPGRDAERES